MTDFVIFSRSVRHFPGETALFVLGIICMAPFLTPSPEMQVVLQAFPYTKDYIYVYRLANRITDQSGFGGPGGSENCWTSDQVKHS